jgi:hypothetical protein
VDPYGRRKLVAAIALSVLVIIGLIGEAIHNKTPRDHGLGYIGMIAAGIVGVIGIIWVGFIR